MTIQERVIGLTYNYSLNNAYGYGKWDSVSTNDIILITVFNHYIDNENNTLEDNNKLKDAIKRLLIKYNK